MDKYTIRTINECETKEVDQRESNNDYTMKISDKYEFKDRAALEKYTREYISTYFDTIIKDGDVVPKNYKLKKISKLTDTELYQMLNHYRDQINSKTKPKTKIAGIKDYYDSGKLTMHHTFDTGSGSDMWFWIFLFIIFVFFVVYYYRKRDK